MGQGGSGIDQGGDFAKAISDEKIEVSMAYVMAIGVGPVTRSESQGLQRLKCQRVTEWRKLFLI